MGFVAEHIQRDVGLDFYVANDLHIKDGCFAGTGTIHVDLNDKAQIIQRISEEQGISREQVAYVGDHTNDIPAWKVVGLPLGMNLKDDSCHAAVDAHFGNFHQALQYFAKHRIV